MKHEIKSRSFSNVSDDELLRCLAELLQKSRRVEAELVAHIGEVDARRLYAREAASSMFVYCTERLNLSEHEAYLRIKVARHSREHPVLLEMLAKGSLPLSAIARLAPHLTKANREAVLSRAAGKSKREIEELIAELSPSPDVPATIRKLPERKQLVPEPASDHVQFGTRLIDAKTLPGYGQLVPEPASDHVQPGTRSIDARNRPERSQLVPDRVTNLHTPAPAQPQAPAQRPVVKPLARPGKLSNVWVSHKPIASRNQRKRSVISFRRSSSSPKPRLCSLATIPTVTKSGVLRGSSTGPTVSLTG